MNNMQTRRRPAQTRRKNAMRGSRVPDSDPTHPRVVSVGTDPTHVRADPSHGQVTARRDAVRSIIRETAEWGDLMEGETARIGRADYVCMGWVPAPSKRFGTTVLVSLWGKCQVCGEGFHAQISRKNVIDGKAPRTCLAHRKRAAA